LPLHFNSKTFSISVSYPFFLHCSMFQGFTLPPTPPSSTASDSEGNVSPDHNPASPSRHMRQQQQQHQHNATTRLFVSSNTSTPSASNRQPIQTPLISNQPVSERGTHRLTEFTSHSGTCSLLASSVNRALPYLT
jgi:hypothetical protein